MSQEMLADEAQLDRAFVGTLERGERNISIDNVEKLCAAVDAPAHELLDPEFATRYGLDGSLTRARRNARLRT
jgi:transcriptional regulator with XRE-family HTH domain